MKSLCVIPARGGSKRIPRKNIREFCGKPIISYSIVAAQKSGLFDEVIVSTDDGEVAEVAQQWGAGVPFMRPAELADDHTPTRPVIQHAIGWYDERGKSPEIVCWMHAASPLIQPDDIQHAYDMLMNSECEFVFTVAEFDYPIQRAVKLMPDHTVEMFYPEHRYTRSQDLPKAYHDAGQFYIGKADSIMRGVPVFSHASRAYVIPGYRVIDIDTPEDWVRAELLYTTLAHRDSEAN